MLQKLQNCINFCQVLSIFLEKLFKRMPEIYAILKFPGLRFKIFQKI